MKRLGVAWYARYLILLEICAEHYSGKKGSEFIVIERDYLRRTLRVVGDQWLTSLRLVGELNGFTFKVVGELIKFEISILSELHHKDSTSSVTRRACLENLAGLDIEEEEEEKIYKKTKSPKADFAESVFDAFYKKYPRKENKTRGKRIFTAQIKNSESFEKINFALDRFLKHHENLKTEKKYIPHFGTWMGQWSDWLDPSTGLCEDFSAGKKEFNGVVPD